MIAKAKEGVTYIAENGLFHADDTRRVSEHLLAINTALAYSDRMVNTLRRLDEYLQNEPWNLDVEYIAGIIHNLLPPDDETEVTT